MNSKALLLSKNLRGFAVVALAGGAVLVAGTNVFAGLNATATASNEATSGTLKLTGSANGVGFSQSVANLAPGDVVNRYYTLTNGGSLDAKDLGLAIAATGTSTLITDGGTSKALTVAINSCSGSWNATNGTCTGTTTTEVAATPLSTFSAKQAFASTKTLSASGATNLQIQVALPDQNETTVNGVLPANTIQNGSVTLNYTFSEAQRVGATTNS